MDQLCPDCGARTEPGEDFCGECGSYLEWDERPAVPEPTRVEVPAPKEPEPAVPEPATAAGPAAPPRNPPTNPPTKPAPAAAVQPAAPAPKPRRRPSAPDREPIQHGDLVCGECGAGNEPTRKFCRRCGHDLQRAEVAKVPWWRRLLTRRTHRLEAGSRPRQRSGFRLRRPNRGAALLLVVAVLGGGGYLFRGAALGLVDTVLDRVMGTEKVNPSALKASSARHGFPASNARDGYTNEPWSPARSGDGKGEWLLAGFESPFRLVYLVITPGVSAKEGPFLRNGRPSRIKVTITRDEGEKVVETIDLKDEAGPQTFHLAVSDVVRVTVEILDSVGPPGSHTAIDEVEFERRQ